MKGNKSKSVSSFVSPSPNELNPRNGEGTESLLGVGPRASTYLSLESPVIIKQFILAKPIKSNSRLEFFLEHELTLYNTIDHPNILQYKSHKHTDQKLRIFYENIPGIKPLDYLLGKCGSCPEEIISLFIREVLLALQFLHRQGIIHRNIKASNVLVSSDGVVKLCDFGLNISPEDLECNLCNYYSSCAYYMTPEVIDKYPLTPASDIWAIGSLIIELISGAPPFHSFPVPSVLYHIQSGEIPPLPEKTSSKLRNFLSMCFQRSPRDRATTSQLLAHEWIVSTLSLECKIETTVKIKKAFHSMLHGISKPTSLPSIPKTVRRKSNGLSTSSPPTLSTSKSQHKAKKKRHRSENIYNIESTRLQALSTRKTKTKLPSRSFSHSLRAKVRIPTKNNRTKKKNTLPFVSRLKQVASDARGLKKVSPTQCIYYENAVNLYSKFNKSQNVISWSLEISQFLMNYEGVARCLYTNCGFGIVLRYLDCSTNPNTRAEELQSVLQVLQKMLKGDAQLQLEFSSIGGIATILSLWENRNFPDFACVRNEIALLLRMLLNSRQEAIITFLFACNVTTKLLAFSKRSTNEKFVCISLLYDMMFLLNDKSAFFATMDDSRLLNNLFQILKQSSNHQVSLYILEMIEVFLTSKKEIYHHFGVFCAPCSPLHFYSSMIPLSDTFQEITNLFLQIDLASLTAEPLPCNCQLIFSIHVVAVVHTLSNSPELRETLAAYGIIQKVLDLLCFVPIHPAIDRKGANVYHELYFHCFNILNNLCVVNQCRQEIFLEFGGFDVLLSMMEDSDLPSASTKLCFQILCSCYQVTSGSMKGKKEMQNLLSLNSEFFLRSLVLGNSKLVPSAMNMILLWLTREPISAFSILNTKDVSRLLLDAVKAVRRGSSDTETIIDCYLNLLIKLRAQGGYTALQKFYDSLPPIPAKASSFYCLRQLQIAKLLSKANKVFIPPSQYQKSKFLENASKLFVE